MKRLKESSDPECAGQAADAMFSSHPGQNGRCTDVIKNSKVRLSSEIGQNHGPVWKIQSFLLNEICTVILWQGLLSGGNSGKFQNGNVC